jgi:hypothetical protein
VEICEPQPTHARKSICNSLFINFLGSVDRIVSGPPVPLSGLYRISAANSTTAAFRERSSTSLFEGKQQLYHQQLSAAVRAGQQPKTVDGEENDQLLKSVELSTVEMCQDGKTRKVLSLAAGCRPPSKDDMQISSTCDEDTTKGKQNKGPSKKCTSCATAVHLVPL